ncbi:SigE family RNA polymerase sigma factor [Demequina sp.]|uniref:SigE family RNA polymerase sigma factor n=1 Tax=Demequina sp. TaxID=2050685 RepID=UPI003A88E928
MSTWSRTLDELVRERGPALFGYAYVLTGNPTEAEDLLQDALVRTFRSGRRVGTIDSAHSYVKRAISSAFIDGHRRASARPVRATGDAGDVTQQPASAVTTDPAANVAATLDLHSAILDLPPRERACVVLRYLDDMPVASVASELGIAVGTVKRYLSDAVARLRVTCADVDFDTTDSVPVDSRSHSNAPQQGGPR